jgi:hypothetical protein
MSTRMLGAQLACTAFVVLAAGAAHAGETTFCNAYITSLPYTISSQGHYCFDRNLSTAMTAGNAITVNSDFVVLDFNNFKLGGGSAGTGTMANGVYASGRSNITVRNGNIRGFRYGIYLDDPGNTTGGHLIEGNLVQCNTAVGISVTGWGVVVRQNTVGDTGGATGGSVVGIEALGLARVTDNFVFHTKGDGSTAAVYGILAADGFVSRNEVSTTTAQSYGGTIYGVMGMICRDNTVDGPASYPQYCTSQVGQQHPPY